MTTEQASALMKLLSASYPNATLSVETIAAYVHQLTDLEFPSTMTAVNRMIQTSKFLPAIAEIRTAQQAEATRAYMQRPQLEDHSHQRGAMTNAERRDWAMKLVMRADEIRAAHGGAGTFWSVYLDQTAELYAENANRIERGEWARPIPRVSELVEALRRPRPVSRVTPQPPTGIERGLVNDAVTVEDRT